MTGGYSISLHESMAAQAIASLVGSSQLRAPEIARGLVDGIWLSTTLNSVTTVTDAINETSPHAGGPAITIGAADRNSLRRRYIRAGLPRATFSYERADGRLPTGATKNRAIEVQHRSGNRLVIDAQMHLAVIEKFQDAERAATRFFCFGEKGDST